MSWFVQNEEEKMFEELKDRLKALLGEQFVEFPPANIQRVAALKAKVLAEERRKCLIHRINDPRTRYEIEFTGDYYGSYKPGIDDIGLAGRYGFGSSSRLVEGLPTSLAMLLRVCASAWTSSDIPNRQGAALP